MTVLYPRSGTGVLTPRLNHLIWSALKAAAPRGRRRDGFLSFAGPVLMVTTAATWFLLLLVGFALIVWPALGTAIQATSGPTPDGFAAALYYSGWSLTTLGTGDLVPQTGTFRLLMVTQAVIGFSVLTLTLTYFMSVYSALVRRNTLALGLHQLSGSTGSAAELTARLGAGGSFDDARSILSDVAWRILDLLESHHSYPVLHYFRMKDARYAMARVALLAVETAAIFRTALSEDHRSLSNSAAIDMLGGSGQTLLSETAKTFLPQGAPDEARRQDDERAARLRFAALCDRLRKAEIATAAEPEEAGSRYLELRSKWIGLTRAFATSMDYSWSDIEQDI